MRVADLDRDHSAVFPEGLDRASAFFYERTAEATYEALALAPGARVLDQAAGLGNDGQALAARGHRVMDVEPSLTLTRLKELIAQREGWKDHGAQIRRVRAFGEAMPFPARHFDASFCKGSLDHFDDPAAGIAELARVTRADGRVVLAVANMDCAGHRWLRFRDRRRFARGARAAGGRRGRLHQHVPPDHFTRYDPELLLSQAAQHLEVEHVEGVSLFWGLPGYTRLVEALPARLAGLLLRAVFALARRFPKSADLLVVAGRPRTSDPKRSTRLPARRGRPS